MKRTFKLFLVQLFYVYSFVMLTFVALVIRIISKNNRRCGRIVFRTDRIGDLIIGAKLINSQDVTVFRTGTTKANIDIQMPKFLYSPKYAWSKMKSLSTIGDNVFVPVSSKTPDMLAIQLLFKRSRRVTVSDTGNNFFAAPMITKLLCDKLLSDYGNEYLNASKWSNPAKQNIVKLHQTSQNIILAPYGSSLKKSLKESDIIRIIDLCCRYYNNVSLVSNIDPYDLGKRFEQKYTNFKSFCSEFASIEDFEFYVKNIRADYLSVDSAPAHIFSKYLKEGESLTVISSSAVIHRFDVPNGKTIRLDCKYNGCNWNCNYGDFRCLNFENLNFKIMQCLKDK